MRITDVESMMEVVTFFFIAEISRLFYQKKKTSSNIKKISQLYLTGGREPNLLTTEK